MKYTLLLFGIVGWCMNTVSPLHAMYQQMLVNSRQTPDISSHSNTTQHIHLSILESSVQENDTLIAETPYTAMRRRRFETNLARLAQEQEIIPYVVKKKKSFQDHNHKRLIEYEYVDPQVKRNELIKQYMIKNKIIKNTNCKVGLYTMFTLGLVIAIPLIMADNGAAVQINFSELLQQWNILFLMPVFYGIYKAPQKMVQHCKKRKVLARDIRQLDQKIALQNEYLFAVPHDDDELCSNMTESEETSAYTAPSSTKRSSESKEQS